MTQTQLRTLHELHVDTNVEYAIDLDLFPGLDDPNCNREPTLLVSGRGFGYRPTEDVKNNEHDMDICTSYWSDEASLTDTEYIIIDSTDLDELASDSEVYYIVPETSDLITLDSSAISYDGSFHEALKANIILPKWQYPDDANADVTIEHVDIVCPDLLPYDTDVTIDYAGHTVEETFTGERSLNLVNTWSPAVSEEESATDGESYFANDNYTTYYDEATTCVFSQEATQLLHESVIDLERASDLWNRPLAECIRVGECREPRNS